MIKLIKTNGEWKVKQAEFQGFVKASLEAIKEDITETKIRLEATHDLCHKNSNKLARLKGWAAGVGGLGGGLISGIAWFFKYLFNQN